MTQPKQRKKEETSTLNDGNAKNSPSKKVYSLNYAELKEILEKIQSIDKTILNGLFTFKKASYKGTILTFSTEDKKKGKTVQKKCTSWRNLRASLAMCLIQEKRVTSNDVINALKSNSLNAREYLLPGKNTPIQLIAGASAADVVAGLKNLWEISKFEPSDLVISLEPQNNEEKWGALKEEAPELYELFQTDIEEKKDEQPDNSSKKAETFIPIPGLPCNRIFTGAPGTGKSWKLSQEAKEHFGENIARVTFHPEYSYYDFVGSYRPKMSEEKDGRIVYGFVPGPFVKILKNALQNPTHPYCLIIEEINRARVAAVFGDIFQLLDRYSTDNPQKGHVAHVSEYPIEPSEELAKHLAGSLKDHKLRLPANLYIWATMNSADQGVFPMDTAFKRRWSFEYQPLNESKNIKDRWDNIRRGINKVLLEKHVNEDKLMGYYFLKEEERKDDTALLEALRGKVLMYLFDDAAKPFRKDIFKGTLLYSELRDNLKLEASNLGIFHADVNPLMRENTEGQPNEGDNSGDIAAEDETDSAR